MPRAPRGSWDRSRASSRLVTAIALRAGLGGLRRGGGVARRPRHTSARSALTRRANPAARQPLQHRGPCLKGRKGAPGAKKEGPLLKSSRRGNSSDTAKTTAMRATLAFVAAVVVACVVLVTLSGSTGPVALLESKGAHAAPSRPLSRRPRTRPSRPPEAPHPASTRASSSPLRTKDQCSK